MSNLGDLKVIWLEAFVATADLKKRTAAAAKLGIQQPDISRHLHRLEKWFGTLLIVGQSSSPMLTDQGKQFLPAARKALEVLQGARPAFPMVTVPPPPPSGADIVVPTPPARPST